MSLTLQQYKDDVLKAHDEGLIVLGEGSDLWGEDDLDSFYDRHGHPGEVLRTNACPLRPAAAILQQLLGSRKKLKWLELGAGVGVAAAQLHQAGCEVDTVSMTALAPHIRPCAKLPLGNLSDIISDTRFGYFSVTADPYLREQRIGKLGQNINVDITREYDVAHERCGPLHYSFHRDRESWASSILDILDSLAEDGVLLLDPCIYPKVYEQIASEQDDFTAIRDYPADTDETIVLLMKNESALAHEANQDRAFKDGIVEWLRRRLKAMV